jgi:hypothetical protein
LVLMKLPLDISSEYAIVDYKLRKESDSL